MLIDKNLPRYIIFAEDSILTALHKISDNKSRIIFSVTEAGLLEGILSDGDIRRWLTTQENIDLNRSVSEISNKQFTFAWQDDTPKHIESLFSERIEFVPLLDRQRRLVAVARRRGGAIEIDQFRIDDESPTFLVAEIGNNHNGSLDHAKLLIDEAVSAGADCAKFQMRSLADLYRNAGKADDAREDLGSQYTLDLLNRFQLDPKQMLEAFDYCKQQGILPLCTPWDVPSFRVLEDYGMPAYKVASADLTNHDFLKILAATGKPLICSTGMSTEAEILESVRLLHRLGAVFVLLHCNSTYPVPFKDVDLSYMDHLKEIGDCPVGYSGHERGYAIALAAVARGAKVVEKHITVDKTMEGNDHKVSLLPSEFRSMVEGIRHIEEAMGSGGARRLSQGELINRETLAKSLVISCDLKAGEKILAEMIEAKSPGRGLQPNRKQDLIGHRAKHAFKAGDFFYPSDVEQETSTSARSYRFSRPWGVPVRYHDFRSIFPLTNPDFLEFHLSYKDLEVSLNEFFAPGERFDLGLIVHSPELFAGDHVLDLCSWDDDYRRRSVRELQRIIDTTRRLTPYFKRAQCPCIVTNVGGFSQDGFLPQTERLALYEMLVASLNEVDRDGVEIVPQTMPPFPWHFGGQRYHNLFMLPEDIEKFCREYDARICLDVSHSQLACNQYKLSFSHFLEQVGPYAAHLHIADAAGLDGEGMQIGDGDIDFVALGKDLRKYAPHASFIPEIWQGHKNDGEGFWQALEQLEGFL